jgi:hypothetical protein
LTTGVKVKVDMDANISLHPYWIMCESGVGTSSFELSGEGITNSVIQLTKVGLIDFTGASTDQRDARNHSIKIDSITCYTGAVGGNYSSDGYVNLIRVSDGELVINNSQLANLKATFNPTTVIHGTSVNVRIKDSNLILSNLSDDVPISGESGTAGNAVAYAWVILIETANQFNLLKITNSTLDTMTRTQGTSGYTTSGTVAGNFISFACGLSGPSAMHENNVVLLNDVYFHGPAQAQKTLWSDTLTSPELYIGNGITSAGAAPDGFGTWAIRGNTSGVMYGLGGGTSLGTISPYEDPIVPVF